MTKLIDNVKNQVVKNVLTIIGILALIYVAFYIGSVTKELEFLRAGSLPSNGAPTQPSAQAPSEPATAKDVDPVSEKDHVRGSRDAKIALIEYSDYECPFCSRFHPTAQQVVDDYDGEVMWVYRHFPLESIHSRARPAAIAAECVNLAGGNDAFWAFTDALYNGEDLSDETLIAEANALGFDITSCLQNAETDSLVDDGLSSGARAGVTGTPGNILLNVETGETLLIPGAIPFAQISQAIDGLL